MLRRRRGGFWLGAPLAGARLDARRRCVGRLGNGDRDLSDEPLASRARGCVFDTDGGVVVQAATQDIGTGTYTVMAQLAADALQMPIHRVRFELGDSRFPTGAGLGRLADRGERRAGGAGRGRGGAAKAVRDGARRQPLAVRRRRAPRIWRWRTGLCGCATRPIGALASRGCSRATGSTGSRRSALPRRATKSSTIRCIPSARNSSRCGSTLTCAKSASAAVSAPSPRAAS